MSMFFCNEDNLFFKLTAGSIIEPIEEFIGEANSYSENLDRNCYWKIKKSKKKLLSSAAGDNIDAIKCS